MRVQLSNIIERNDFRRASYPPYILLWKFLQCTSQSTLERGDQGSYTCTLIQDICKQIYFKAIAISFPTSRPT